jgi:hypothetical protein
MTTDTSSPSPGFTSILAIDVKFGPNPRYPELHDWLNRIYQDVLPKPERLFSDPATRTTLLTQNLLPFIRDIIIKEMILQSANETEDTKFITPMIENAAIHVSAGHLPNRRLSNQNLLLALEFARSKSLQQIQLVIDTTQFYISTADPISYHDWSVFSTAASLAVPRHDSVTPVPTPVPTPAPVSASTPVSSPAPVDYVAMASAMVTAFAQAQAANSPHLFPSYTNSTHLDTEYASADVREDYFYTADFPDDVKARYERKKNGGIILGSTVTTPYSDGNFYFKVGTHAYVLADGTLWICRQIDEKEVMRQPEYCRDDSHVGIRRWHPLFERHLAAHGIFVPSFSTYRKDWGGQHGFVAGDTKSDIPKRMDVSLAYMSHIIYRLLTHKDMFPSDSTYKSIVEACNGDGYLALKSIMIQVHPAFHPEPATLIASYPYQRNLSFLQYYHIFLDFLQLRGLIQDYDSSIDKPAELDIFINRSRYATFLSNETRAERRDPDKVAKYQGTQLVETLQSILRRLPSVETPRNAQLPKEASPGYSTPKQRRPPQHTQFYTPLNPVSTTAATQIVDNTSSGFEPDVFDDVYKIDVPQDPQQRRIYTAYTAAVNQIKQKPQDGHASNCLLCGHAHAFKDCPVLQNTPFLQQHLIRFKQFLNIYEKAYNKTFVEPTPEAPINYYGVLNQYDDDTPDDNSIDNFDPSQDFQQGRL